MKTGPFCLQTCALWEACSPVCLWCDSAVLPCRMTLQWCQGGCGGANAVGLGINKKELQRPFSWTCKDKAVLVSLVFAASHRNTLDWRIVYYSELSITAESCFAIPLSFHSCLSLMSCSGGHCSVVLDCLCCVGSWVVLLGCKPKTQQEVQGCPPGHCAGLAVGICLSSAGILPMAPGAPSFALSLSAAAGPFHSGTVCCPGPGLGSWMLGWG